MLKAKEIDKKTGYLYREAIMKSFALNLKSRSNLIAANLSKVNSGDLSQLRQSLTDSDAKLLITKVSLFRRFLKKIKKQALLAESNGPAGLIFTGEDILAVSKVLSEFAKEHEDFKLLGAFYQDKALSVEELEGIARLPGRQELIAKALLSIKFPLIKFRAVLEQLMRKLLLCLLSAKQGKKEQVKEKQPTEVKEE